MLAMDHIASESPGPSIDFEEEILKHIAIGRDVVLEQTIELRLFLSQAAANSADTFGRQSVQHVCETLDVVLAMRPIYATKPFARISWWEFITAEGCRPLDLLLEQPARLVRPHSYGSFVNEVYVDDSIRLRTCIDDALLEDSLQSFEPLRLRIEKLQAVFRMDGDVSAAGHHEWLPQLDACVQKIVEHYRKYAQLVCTTARLHTQPSAYNLKDLLSTEAEKEINGTHQYCGGNVTLGGIGLGYYRVSQHMIGKMMQQDEMVCASKVV